MELWYDWIIKAGVSLLELSQSIGIQCTNGLRQHMTSIANRDEKVLVRREGDRERGRIIIKTILPLKDLGKQKDQKDPNSLRYNQRESMGKQDTAYDRKRCYSYNNRIFPI